MKKLIKDWWPLLLIAGWWLWKKRTKPIVKQKAEATQSDVGNPTPGGLVVPPIIDWRNQKPFMGGECVYGSPIP